MAADTPIRLSPFGRLKWGVRMGLARRSVRLRRWMWDHYAQRSEFVSRHLDGLKGIEIGAAAHNDYGLDAINVDRFDSRDGPYGREQMSLCGRIRHVDLIARGDALPFADDAVDFVFVSHVIEHFPDPIRALKEWLRVARRYVLVVVPHRDRTFDHELALTPPEEFARRHGEGFDSDEDKHWSVWTCESFLAMCERFGLPVLEHQDPDDKMGNGFAVLLDASVRPSASG